MFRWVRQGNVTSTRERWFLFGLVQVVTHPRPHWQARQVLFVPGIRESCGLPARPAMLLPLDRCAA